MKSAPSKIRLADAFGWAVVVLVALAAAAGLVAPGLYRDNAAMVAQAQGSDLATLLVAVPLLALGLWAAGRAAPAPSLAGRITTAESFASLTLASRPLTPVTVGRLVAMGSLGFIAYTYAIYAFSVVINPATPFHIAILSLSTWSLVLMVLGLDSIAIEPDLGALLPRRTTAAFLVACVALFALTWSSGIVSAIVSGRLPEAVTSLDLPTSPVYALDLAFALPLLALGGALLAQRDRRGAAAAIALLTFVVVMGLAVLGSFAFAAGRGAPVDPFVTGMFAVISGLGALLLVRGCWPIHLHQVRTHPAHT